MLCRSWARALKERAKLERRSEGLTQELVKIDVWLRRSPQADQEADGRRIGCHLGTVPVAAAIHVAAVLSDSAGRAIGL